MPTATENPLALAAVERAARNEGPLVSALGVFVGIAAMLIVLLVTTSLTLSPPHQVQPDDARIIGP